MMVLLRGDSTGAPRRCSFAAWTGTPSSSFAISCSCSCNLHLCGGPPVAVCCLSWPSSSTTALSSFTTRSAIFRTSTSILLPSSLVHPSTSLWSHSRLVRSSNYLTRTFSPSSSSSTLRDCSRIHSLSDSPPGGSHLLFFLALSSIPSLRSA